MQRTTKHYYVYTLVDPRRNSVFYVGKGKEKRPYDHGREARSGCECRKCVKIRSIWDAGYDVRIDYVYQTDTSRDALAYEKQLIADIGRRRLTNRNSGGTSDAVETWEDPGTIAGIRELKYRMRQEELTRRAKEIEEEGVSTKRKVYWRKQIEKDLDPPLVSKPPPWLKRII